MPPGLSLPYYTINQIVFVYYELKLIKRLREKKTAVVKTVYSIMLHNDVGTELKIM